jgi:hypothetical protein
LFLGLAGRGIGRVFGRAWFLARAFLAWKRLVSGPRGQGIGPSRTIPPKDYGTQTRVHRPIIKPRSSDDVEAGPSHGSMVGPSGRSNYIEMEAFSKTVSYANIDLEDKENSDYTDVDSETK